LSFMHESREIANIIAWYVRIMVSKCSLLAQLEISELPANVAEDKSPTNVVLNFYDQNLTRSSYQAHKATIVELLNDDANVLRPQS
jgi:hypothetical protein